MSVLHISASILAYAGAGLATWAAIGSIWPVLLERAERDEKEFVARLLDLYMDRGWARHAARIKYFGPLVVGVATGLATRNIVLATAAGAATYALPTKVFAQAESARRKAVELELPQALEMMADGTRAGLALPEVIRLVSVTARPPVSTEFAVMLRAIELGDSIEHVLRQARTRLGSASAQLMISALLVNQRAGGDVTKVLERVSKAARQLAEVQQRVEAETASVRFSARAMVATIPLFAMVLWVMDPSGVEMLFSTFLGNAALLLVAALATVGYRSIIKLANPEV